MPVLPFEQWQRRRPYCSPCLIPSRHSSNSSPEELAQRLASDTGWLPNTLTYLASAAIAAIWQDATSSNCHVDATAEIKKSLAGCRK